MKKNIDKRYPLTNEIIERISKVPEVDLSMIDNAEELCILCIKDLTKYPDLREKYAKNNDYIIIFSYNEYLPISCGKFQLSDFVNKIMDH